MRHRLVIHRFPTLTGLKAPQIYHYYFSYIVRQMWWSKNDVVSFIKLLIFDYGLCKKSKHSVSRSRDPHAIYPLHWSYLLWHKSFNLQPKSTSDAAVARRKVVIRPSTSSLQYSVNRSPAELANLLPLLHQFVFLSFSPQSGAPEPHVFRFLSACDT